jgi:hypothetical protein
MEEWRWERLAEAILFVWMLCTESSDDIGRVAVYQPNGERSKQEKGVKCYRDGQSKSW